MWTMSRLGAVGTELRRAAVLPAAVLAVPAPTVLGDVSESLAFDGDKRFQERYAKAGGSDATFLFPPEGNHSWAYRGQQLQSLKPDLMAVLNG